MLCSKTRFFSSNAVPPFLGGHFPLLEESLSLVKKREHFYYHNTVNQLCCCCSVTQVYSTLCDPMDCNTEKVMAPHSSTLAWQIPWMEEPGRLQSMGSLGVWHDWATSLSLFTFHFHALEKEMATHSSVLAWSIPGTGEPGGLPSMVSRRVGHDWSDLAAAAGLQHTRLPYPLPSLKVCSNSCPLNWWCHPIISSSVIPFSSHLQSFPASGSFQIC